MISHKNNPKLRILIGVETLCSGGAESFVVRLANALAPYHTVYLVILRGDMMDKRVAGKLGDSVKLTPVVFPFEWFLLKFDSLMFRLRVDFSLRDYFAISHFQNLLRLNQIDIIHTNQFKVDYVFYKANKTLRIPHLNTIHGDYLNFSEQSKLGKLRLLNFREKAIKLLTQINGIVYISDHQLNYFVSEWNLLSLKHKAIKIYNGVELKSSISRTISNSEFTKQAFVFGMVARGIREKGWEYAIQAFIRIYKPGVQLVLVGESEYLDQLKSIYRHPAIYFIGYSENPLEWVELFDVGLLPSVFASESLPTTVIEYLMMGKPVIASDKGEVRNMLERQEERSGIILAVNDSIISQTELVDAMQTLMSNQTLYNTMAIQAKEHSEIFGMQKCVNSYLAVYRTLSQS